VRSGEARPGAAMQGEARLGPVGQGMARISMVPVVSLATGGGIRWLGTAWNGLASRGGDR